MQRCLPIPFAPLSSSFALFLALLLASPPAGFAVEANGPWGVYPDCVAPAVPLEVQAWWLNDGEVTPSHLHHAACVPNARTADCSDPSNPVVTKATPFTSRVIAYNYPSRVNIIRWSWQSEVEEVLDVGWQCSPGSGQIVGSENLEQCVWHGDMTLDPARGNDGLDELRLTPNISENQFGNRHFATLNFQVCTGNSSSSYRGYPDPIGRGWYEGFGYSNVRVNYMDFFEGPHETIPTVSGVVELRIDHQKGSGSTRSRLWENMNHHKFPTVFAKPPPVGVAHPSGGKLLYDKDGLFDGAYQWDTRELPDGQNVLFVQTVSTDDTGSIIGGLKLLFNVQNGNGGGAANEPPPTECSDGLDNDFDEQVDFPNDLGCDDFSDDSEDSETTTPEEPAQPEEPAKPEEPAEPSEPEQPVVGSEGDPGVQDANARRLERKLAKVERKIAKLETRRDGFTAHASSLQNPSATQVDPASGKLRRILNKRDKIEAKLQQLMAKQANLLASLK
jgi:hypothetical protein